MIRYLFFLAVFFYGCGYENDRQRLSGSKDETDIMSDDDRQQITEPLEDSEWLYQKGDFLAFKTNDENYIVAALIDATREGSIIWYKFCFTDYSGSILPAAETIKSHKFFGRKIQSTVDAKGYFVAFDFESLTDSCLVANRKDIMLVCHLDLDFRKMQMGSLGAIDNLTDFFSTQELGMQRRLLPPDDYRDHLKKFENFRPDQYFPIADFLR